MAEHKHLLWLVCFDEVDEDGDGTNNMDLFVVAKDHAEAEKLWYEHYRETPENLVEMGRLFLQDGQQIADLDPDEVEYSQQIKKDQRPATVFLVPTSELLIQSPHPIAWSAVQRFDT